MAKLYGIIRGLIREENWMHLYRLAKVGPEAGKPYHATLEPPKDPLAQIAQAYIALYGRPT